MNELANIGKMLSIFCALCVYACVWFWAIGHQKDCNRNAIWEVLIARLFIGLHIIFIFMWFIWSWNN